MGSWSAIWLKPASDATRSGMPKRGIKINETPYDIGRKPKRGKQIPRTDIILQFADERPYNLSRYYFMIELGRPGLMIRDAGSQLGTLVNDERIGLDEPRNAVSLHIGENAIEADGYDTPFHFIIVILARTRVFRVRRDPAGLDPNSDRPTWKGLGHCAHRTDAAGLGAFSG
jgi:hypothetical protein